MSNSDRDRDLIFQAIDETISSQDFSHLQDALDRDDELLNDYLRCVNLSEALIQVAAAKTLASGLGDLHGDKTPVVRPTKRPTSRPNSTGLLRQLALGLTLLVVLAASSLWSQRSHQASRRSPRSPAKKANEVRLAGHGTLSKAIDVVWSGNTPQPVVNEILKGGPLAFEKGVIEIDFFSGATVIVEGPASLNIESDWRLELARGRMRATVPPAARGFVVTAAGAEIIDLGTEFALQVEANSARVKVIEGEIELRGRNKKNKHLFTGDLATLAGSPSTSLEAFTEPVTASELERRDVTAEARRFRAWQMFSLHSKTDPRLIAYFPIANGIAGRLAPNAASTGSQHDGYLTGPVEKAPGRFGQKSTALQFTKPGARTRTRIDGEFHAFTFSCWVRIDELQNRYNAIFMGDGYENGEPHWQIRDDGRLMFSVMIDDSQQVSYFSSVDQEVVADAGLHRVYLTKPFWDISQSGNWFHLAAVYNPAARVVAQYVNGVQVSSHTITDKYYTDSLHIGPAEIGNWGQPFRQTPLFSVRNLNGAIDELAIFGEALSDKEIKELFDAGTPSGLLDRGPT
jgi:hypothetical protein